jgi:hypothetical protein
MDDASAVLQTVEDTVLSHGDHSVLCQSMHTDPPTHMVTVSAGMARNPSKSGISWRLSRGARQPGPRLARLAAAI